MCMLAPLVWFRVVPHSHHRPSGSPRSWCEGSSGLNYPLGVHLSWMACCWKLMRWSCCLRTLASRSERLGLAVGHIELSSGNSWGKGTKSSFLSTSAVGFWLHQPSLLLVQPEVAHKLLWSLWSTSAFVVANLLVILWALVWWAHASCFLRSPFWTLREGQNLLILHAWTFLTTFGRNHIWAWGVCTKVPCLSIWRKVGGSLPGDTALVFILGISLHILQIFGLVFRKLLKFLSILMNSFKRVWLQSSLCLESFCHLSLPSLLLHSFQLLIFLLAIQ